MRERFRDGVRAIRSLPSWQRVAILLAWFVPAFAVVGWIHGPIAALASIATALVLGWLLITTDHDTNTPRAFIDISRPAISHFRLAIGAILAILCIEIGLGLIRAVITPEQSIANHSVATQASTSPSTGTIAMFVVAVVFVGPFIEELVFRNGLQKLLAVHTGPSLAIVVTSVIFAVLHVPSYGGFTAPLASLSLPITGVFLSSCIFGYVYYRTENVIAAWFAHGGMNTLSLIAALT